MGAALAGNSARETGWAPLRATREPGRRLPADAEEDVEDAEAGPTAMRVGCGVAWGADATVSCPARGAGTSIR
jgi:hypothetical protein